MQEPSRRAALGMAAATLALFLLGSIAIAALYGASPSCPTVACPPPEPPVLPPHVALARICQNDETVDVHLNVLAWYIDHGACECACPCHACGGLGMYVCPDGLAPVITPQSPACVDPRALGEFAKQIDIGSSVYAGFIFSWTRFKRTSSSSTRFSQALSPTAAPLGCASTSK